MKFNLNLFNTLNKSIVIMIQFWNTPILSEKVDLNEECCIWWVSKVPLGISGEASQLYQPEAISTEAPFHPTQGRNQSSHSLI
jgi:hypothetical protein